MPRKARHLEMIEESKKINQKPNEVQKMRKMIANARDDEFKMNSNLYAKSLGYNPPNVLSYEIKPSKNIDPK